MTAIPDSINLSPETTKEHLIVINQKIDVVMESQVELSETLCDYMQRTNDWIKCHDIDLHGNIKVLTRHDEKIDQLEKKVNAWNMGNTIAVIVAAVMAFFGLKGS